MLTEHSLANGDTINYGLGWAITGDAGGRPDGTAFHGGSSPGASGMLHVDPKSRLAVVILSGDRASVVAAVAETLGVEEARGDMKPAEKIAFLKTLRANGRKTLMVGDGMNDAPALAAADVSLSPITGAEMVRVIERWEDPSRSEFTAESPRHVTVYGTNHGHVRPHGGPTS